MTFTPSVLISGASTGIGAVYTDHFAAENKLPAVSQIPIACGRIRVELREPARSPRLDSNVLGQSQLGTAIVDYKVAIHTTLLLVDDDKQQLELRSLVLKKSGFVVLTADSPIEALAILAEPHGRKVSVAILDYEMPVMNGCVLADYLKARYPDLKIILHSGLFDIPESEMSSVDSFVPKGGGIVRLLGEISPMHNTARSGPSATRPVCGE